jgi:hypothetical protein
MSGDLTEAAAFTVRATRVSVLLAGACVTLLCLAAPVLIPLTYGAQFAGSVAAVFALAPGLFALGAGRQVSAYLVRLNRPLTMSVLSVGALVVNVAVNLWAIPRWGIVGCALASSVSYTLIAVVQSVRFARASATPVLGLLPGRAELTEALGYLSARLHRPAAEHVLVAPEPGAAGLEVAQLEPAVADEAEHLLGPGHLERVPADPVDQVVTAGHAARPRGRTGAALAGDGAYRSRKRPHRRVAAEVRGAESDQEEPSHPA